jgi:Flp pilus assembly protein TadG
LTLDADTVRPGVAPAGGPPAVPVDSTSKRVSYGRSEEGQTLVEFALVAPVLLLILFGIVQFGIAFKNSIVVTDSVRAGARKAAVSRSASDPTGAARQAVVSAAGDLDAAKLKVDVRSTWVAGDKVTVTATYPYKINILGIVVASGDLHSTTVERVE